MQKRADGRFPGGNPLYPAEGIKLKHGPETPLVCTSVSPSVTRTGLGLKMFRGLLVLVIVAGALADVSNNKGNGQRTNGPNNNKPGRFLSLPVAEKCVQRPKQWRLGNHHYFYSGNISRFAGKKFDWLDARNECREFCMDLVSIENEQENNMVLQFIQRYDVPYIWTSGRLCDFKGCEDRKDLLPLNVFGWFWSGTRAKIQPTNRVPQGFSYNPWSQTGHKKTPQPDNAEYDINQTTESCLSVLNNVYNDGINWHDVACYHEKPFICEDSDELLNYIASTNRGIRL
ncbi:Hypothetical predicted protein [Cloeon dipterum]|uniref:C-type lectin domain-containing protein n=1 Tax=Cloeon dipterum TaxID=197152 RepID=A0A8S1DFM2_9INSE|nr:Hypothetical predicted protein [Cloeon dipterum]